ncbi:hypothetical protein B0T17DRAFT_489969 [Bombardia bombarda]|uniref:C2H2-type domain-containing protein n=1 Tax=Bombardia bombarda TaxID=252184 RepID=A0AA39XBT5_9PEZI|nr:hypothetical protein B0T17DRAFT_489969 [Bombardia bombarda]
MSTTAAPNLAHDVPLSDLYDPDDVLPRNSPLLTPHRPKLRLSPSPSPIIPYHRVSPPPSPGTKKSNRRNKVQPSQGDAVLLNFLGDGKRPDIAIQASRQALPSDNEEEDNSIFYESDSSLGGAADMGALDLKTLAAGALSLRGFVSPSIDPGGGIDGTELTPSATKDGVQEQPPPEPPVQPPVKSVQTVQTMQAASPSPYSPDSALSREAPSMLRPLKKDVNSPTGSLSLNHHGEGLPPIHINSPRSDASGHTPLPPIRVQIGDLKQLETKHEQERLRKTPSFPHSPPGALTRLPAMHGHHTSPPVSPAETFRSRDPMSPAQTSSNSHTSMYYINYPQPNAFNQRSPRAEYSGSSTTETPSSDQSTPATVDRMSIDGITNHQGTYHCQYPGCNAPPFQTQYLLNSHANVHSSVRPHYCPVAGCSRSEGGKGFKRKNEMIRHGLVHDSPGYVCPFCPDREHKYPRPDNLQRYVYELFRGLAFGN